MANRFFRKLTRDPRFLDRVQRRLYEELYRPDMTSVMLDEIDRIERENARFASNRVSFVDRLNSTRELVTKRDEILRRLQDVADVAFTTHTTTDTTVLSVFARSLASLRLVTIELREPANDVQLFEDRDGDGRISSGDRELPLDPQGTLDRREKSPAGRVLGRVALPQRFQGIGLKPTPPGHAVFVEGIL